MCENKQGFKLSTFECNCGLNGYVFMGRKSNIKMQSAVVISPVVSDLTDCAFMPRTTFHFVFSYLNSHIAEQRGQRNTQLYVYNFDEMLHYFTIRDLTVVALANLTKI